MRRLLCVAVAGAMAGLVAAPSSGGADHDRPGVRRSVSVAVAMGPRVSVGAGITVRVPVGWHLLHGRLSDVVDPVPRVALASFAAMLSSHECACGYPNVLHFPRSGAFLFIWERLRISRGALLRIYPRRPARFNLTGERAQRFICQGPSDGLLFRDAQRGLEADIYVGPDVGATVRAQLLAALDSLAVGRR